LAGRAEQFSSTLLTDPTGLEILAVAESKEAVLLGLNSSASNTTSSTSIPRTVLYSENPPEGMEIDSRPFPTDVAGAQ
jgi:hypothetical protein